MTKLLLELKFMGKRWIFQKTLSLKMKIIKKGQKIKIVIQLRCNRTKVFF